MATPTDALSTPLLIGGTERHTAGSFPVFDPASAGTVIGHAASATTADALDAVAAAQFGPALPVIPYNTEAEAIAAANNTWSGLCSSVWSADTEHAMSVARQLRTGVTFVNNHNATAVDERAPFGGVNQSGVGRELGREGLHGFTETYVMAVPEATEGTH